VVFQAPAQVTLRAEYDRAEQSSLRKLCIQRVPYATKALDEVFRMAVSRGFTFQETKAGVVGLQDCVILLSVFDHLRTNPTSAAFVSHDAIFSRIPSLTADFGVNLRLISGLTDLEEVFDAAQSAALDLEFKGWWAGEVERIMNVLEASRNLIEAFLGKTVDSAEIEKLFSGHVVTLEPPTVGRIGHIRPELQGAANGPICFSCDVSVSWGARVEQPLYSLASLIGLQSFPGPFTAAEITQSRTATVELAAQVGADDAKLELRTARISDYGSPKVGG